MHRIIIAATVAFFAFAGLAVAQDFVSTAPVVQPGDTMVDVNSWYALIQPYLTMIASVIIPAVVAWVGALFARWTGVQIEGKLRDSLQTALTNGAGLIIQEMGSAASTAKGLNVGNSAVAKAIDYVKKAAPDAIEHWNLSPESLAKKLEAKLGLLTPVGGTGAVPMHITNG